MATKGKIKPHPSFSSLPQFKKISDQDFEIIAKLLEVKEICPKIKALMKGHIENYLVFEADFPKQSRPADKKVIMESLYQQTSSLIKIVQESLPLVIDYLVDADPELANLDSQNLLSSLFKLRSANKKALEVWKPGKAGPKKSREGLKRFILSMGRVYTELTGKKPSYPHKVSKRSNNALNPNAYIYDGEFFNFIDLCLNLIGIKENNNALATQIQKTMQEWKE